MNTATTHKVKLCVNLECSNVVDIPSLDAPGKCFHCAQAARKQIDLDRKSRAASIRKRNEVTTLIKQLRGKMEILADLKDDSKGLVFNNALDAVSADLESMCHRLAHNFNMSYKAPTDVERSRAATHLERVINEAIDWLSGQAVK